MQKLHVISHTHWDREWYLTFQQFRLKLVRLIDNLLDILEHDPDFKYFMLDGQTIVLDDYLEIRPEKESVLKQYIQQGRILIGPWHILPDMFLVSAEAHIRNLLEGARTARKFGPKMPVGYIPDPFGHPGQVPQILTGFGIEVAALWRGLSDQPAELWWESPDGSRVLLVYLRDSYSNGAWLPVHDSERFAQQISKARDSLAAHSAVADHLIMLGTDHMEPSPYTSDAIAYADEYLADTQVLHSSLPEFVQSISDQISGLEQDLPTIRGEFRACSRSHLLPGILSTRMWIKQRNYRSLNLLERWAEPFAVFAEQMIGESEDSPGFPDLVTSKRIHNVAPIIRQAWRLLMENHPHDSICGCSVDQVHEEMKPRFDQADQIGEEITLQALQALSQAVDTRETDAFTAIVLFNPLGTTHQDLVNVELRIPAGIAAFELIDAGNAVIPHERPGSSHGADPSVTDSHGPTDTPRTVSIRFVSPEIPALGWRTVWVRAIEAPGAVTAARSTSNAEPLAKPDAGDEAKPPFVIENEVFLVEASQADGTLIITDRRTDTVFTGLNRFVDGGDAGDEYNYSPPNKDTLYTPKVVSLKAFRHGLLPSLEIEYDLQIPAQISSDRNRRSSQTVSIPICSRVTLAPGVPRLDVHTKVNNQAKDHRLRVHFPAPFAVQGADHDGHFEVVRRPVGVPEKGEGWIEDPRPEVPQRAFTDISDGETGLMIANRGLPEVEVLSEDTDTGTEIALTLLRCVGWLSRNDIPVRQGHAGPASETPGAQVLGPWHFDYAIIPHCGNWGEAYQQAYAFQSPLRAIQTSIHAGELPVQGSFLAHSPSEFVISAVKEAETGAGWIVRGYNISSETIQLNLKPLRPFAHAVLVNLAEEEIAPMPIADDGSIQISVSGHKVVSVMLGT